MTYEFDPSNLSDAAIDAQIESMNNAYNNDANRIFEDRAYHGAIALSGAFVVLRFTGIETAEQVGNWCGGLATVALASAALVSPEHRSLSTRIRGLVDEFKHARATDNRPSPRITIAQLVRQEAAELESRSSSWFWSKWNHSEE